MVIQRSVMAQTYQNIHNIITRAIRISIKHSQEYQKTDQKTREGFFNYVQTLTTVVNAHHLTEDEIVFPYFKGLLPEAPISQLIKQHHIIVGFLDEINLSMMANNVDVTRLYLSLNRFSDLWHPHIKIETDEILSKIDSVIHVDEQIRLSRLSSEHGQGNSKPPYLAIPFLLYNLPIRARKVVARDIPKEVTEHLVPVVWKDKWESMKPFLLE